jgi:hypothetical protein
MAETPAAFSTTIYRPPSCIEFLPSDERFVFIGTYTLEKREDGEGFEIQEGSETMASSQKRSGSVLIMRFEDDIP